MHTCTHAFFGPVMAYVHREGREFHAYVDPVGVVGTGRTLEESLRSASELMRSYFETVTELLVEHGPAKVRVLSPLSRDEKRGAAAILKGMLFAEVKSVRSIRPGCLPLRAEPIDRMAKYLMSGRRKEVRLAGLQEVTSSAG